MSAAHKHQNSTEYRQICLLQRVKRDRETEKGGLPVEHLGYKVRGGGGKKNPPFNVNFSLYFL